MNDEIRGTLLEKEPGEFVLNSLQRLLDEDAYLLQIDANERSLTHRVAVYLEHEFPDWHVDCEFNRDKHEPKELILVGGNPDAYDVNAQTVFPDIVVHRRGTDQNYLVIEFKKTSSTVGDEKDFLKLQAFVGQLGYEYALFVEIAVGYVKQGIERVTWVHE